MERRRSTLVRTTANARYNLSVDLRVGLSGRRRCPTRQVQESRISAAFVPRGKGLRRVTQRAGAAFLQRRTSVILFQVNSLGPVVTFARGARPVCCNHSDLPQFQ